jgi:YidC/Oxa1 family membrane protein insertase
MRTDLLFSPAVTFKADSPATTYEVAAYLGPKHYKQLEHADDVVGFTTGFKNTIDLGWFGFIGRPLMWLLLQFYSFFQNWGLAIVLLTIVVKSLTVPFTTKSMRSMKAMAVLAPQMKALQEKYKDDKQRLQMETMALYKQHGANPLTGCLPLLLQMPIWLALYRMLSSTGELYNQAFSPTASSAAASSATDPSQKMQQRMMQWGMPLMFGIMSFFFPAGLTLYIFTNTILSALHSIYMNKFDKKSIALAAKIKESQAAAEQAKLAAAEKAKTDAAAKASGASPSGASSDARKRKKRKR